MAITEEIERRVKDADSTRSARRAAAAKQIGELAQRRSAVAEQLNEIETQLGQALAAVSDVIDIGELAQFTDVPAADLTRWLDATKPTRTKSKRSTAASIAAKTDTSRRPSTTKTTPTRQPSTPSEPAVPNTTSPAQVPLKVP